MKLKIAKNGIELNASVDESGLLIDYGWALGIPKADAIKYVNQYNSSPSYGFQETSMGVVLTHRDAKLMLSREEANAIVNFIREAYSL